MAADADCFAALYRVAGGDTAGAAVALRRLRAFAATDHPPIAREDWRLIDFRVCPLLLQVLLEGGLHGQRMAGTGPRSTR